MGYAIVTGSLCGTGDGPAAVIGYAGGRAGGVDGWCVVRGLLGGGCDAASQA